MGCLHVRRYHRKRTRTQTEARNHDSIHNRAFRTRPCPLEPSEPCIQPGGALVHPSQWIHVPSTGPEPSTEPEPSAEPEPSTDSEGRPHTLVQQTAVGVFGSYPWFSDGLCATAARRAQSQSQSLWKLPRPEPHPDGAWSRSIRRTAERPLRTIRKLAQPSSQPPRYCY